MDTADFGLRTRAFLPACMGGFCNVRKQCQQHLTDNRRFVVERLCQRGQETPRPPLAVALRVAA
jgi:hypothetical protein